MEIERGVKIEEFDGDWEAGLSSGSRSVEQLPAYTNAEILRELGDVSGEIERLFRGGAEREDSEQDLVSGGTA